MDGRAKTRMRSEYPQAEESRAMLADALESLMAHKHLQDISVTELTRQAGVSRRTFYRHFSTTSDVLAYRLRSYTEGFVRYFRCRYEHQSVGEAVSIYFEYWGQHRAFLLVLKRCGLLYLLLEQAMPAMRAGIRLTSGQTGPDGLTEAERAAFDAPGRGEEMERAFTFMSGGAFALLSRWLEDDSEEPPAPEELGESVERAMRFFASEDEEGCRATPRQADQSA